MLDDIYLHSKVGNSPELIALTVIDITAELGMFDMVIEHILSMKSSTEEIRKKVYDIFPGEEKGAYEAITNSEEAILDHVIMPGIIHALFINAYNIFEHSINKLCDAWGEEYGSKLVYKDIQGNGIERATDYLEKVIGFELKSSKEWNDFKKWNKIRNCLVHKNCLVNNKEKETAESLGIFVREVNKASLNIVEERLLLYEENFKQFMYNMCDFLKKCY